MSSTDNDKQELEAILDVFTTEGWKYILSDINKQLDAVDNIDDVQTVEELYRRKGELATLRWFASLKEWYQYSEQMLDD